MLYMRATLIKSLTYMLGMIFVILLFPGSANAAEKPLIVESYTGDSGVSLYLKSSDTISADVTVQIGTTVCEDVRMERLNESGTLIRTLIMVDNSLSVPKSDRADIEGALQTIIEERADNEEISIATFDEHIRILNDYTSNQSILSSVLQLITYEDLETYLTDVLYEVLSEELDELEENVYYRVLVVSDGVDSKTIGYTKDELNTLIKERSIPIYSIGVQTGNNNEQLENMFAISRLSKANGILLNEEDYLQELLAILSNDRKIVRISVFPGESLLDGSTKVVKITLADGENVSVEMKMPQIIETEDVVASVYMPETEAVNEENEQDELPAEKKVMDCNYLQKIRIILFIFISVVGVLAGMCIVMVKKKKHKKQSEDVNLPVNGQIKESDSIKKAAEGQPDLTKRNTVVMFNSMGSRDIYLEDINNPFRTFRCPFKKEILVGADNQCDIVIDWDEYVSGRHCWIVFREEHIFLIDANSTNGTFLNDKRITSETEIYPGNLIQVGDTKLRFEIE